VLGAASVFGQLDPLGQGQRLVRLPHLPSAVVVGQDPRLGAERVEEEHLLGHGVVEQAISTLGPMIWFTARPTVVICVAYKSRLAVNC